jgi:signal transduction histidine kinase/DNA-binding response OmpR family regulator/ligand-binding sensor domain-containing protein
MAAISTNKPLFLLFFGLLFGLYSTGSAQRLPNPEVITIDDGLCFRHVNSIVQDKNGLMWFGTANGLSRYDGYRFVNFGKGPSKDNYFPALDFAPGGAVFPNDSTLWTIADFQLWATNIRTLSTKKVPGIKGRVLKMTPGKNKDIWLVSDNEINQFLWRYTDENGFEKISSVPHLRLDNSSIQIDTFGGIWWSTTTKGLQQFSPDGKWLDETKIDSTFWSGTTLYHNDFFIDSRNRFFIYSKNPDDDQQLWLYDPDTKTKEVLLRGMEEFNFTAAEDSWGNVWFSKEDGLIQLKPYGSIIDYTQPALLALDFKNILCIFEDSKNTLWVATDGGLLKFPIGQPFFDAIFSKNNVGWGNAMRGISQNSKGDIFFLHESDTGGVYCLMKEEEKLKKAHLGMIERDLQHTLSGAKYLAFDEKRNCLWTMTTSLLKIDWTNQKIKSYPSISFNREYSTFNPLEILPDGRLLVGNTLDKLCIFDPESGRVKKIFENNSQSYFRIYPKVLLADKNDRIWVGTHDQGLYLFNLNGDLLKHYNTESTPSISNNHVVCLYLDEKRTGLWAGTLGGGLCYIDANSENIRVFNKKSGLPDNNIVSILGEGDNLWIGTYNGLSSFHKKENSFRNFFVEDGLTHNEFNFASAYKDTDGQMYFGGLNGIISFHPKNLIQQELNPPLQLTRFLKYDQDSDSLFNVPLSGNSNEVFEISPDISYFSVEWTLPNYFNPDKNQYFSWMEGLEQDWSFLGNTPSIRFNKLPPGEYVLHLKGKDSRGNWSEQPLELKINVLTPWWKKWWALGLYFIVAIAGVTLIRKRELGRILLQNELEKEQKEAQKQAELEQAKTRFFANLSHELRTPLTVILGMSEKIQEPNNAKSLIQRSGRNLLRLVNQMLDFSKIGAGQLHLNLQSGNLVAFIGYLVENYHYLADHKKVQLTFEPTMEQLAMEYDKEKIQHIVSNLLSNAIKFTPKGGEVVLSLTLSEPMVCIEVRDNGIGIPPEALDRIFDRYYQVQDPLSKGEPGTGIGLAFTKELVELMGGAIEVESTEGTSTVFRVFLPMIQPNPSPSTEPTPQQLQPTESKEFAVKNPHPHQSTTQKTSLLFIEDSPEVVSYLRSILDGKYDITIAENGEIGIQKAIEKIPDIIISDVMMPIQDGFAVTQFLKNDERTSHIPIVLLTAKADAESRLMGLTRGADAYLSKPFNERELWVRLDQLIAIRKKLQSRYAQFNLPEPTEDVGLRIEDAFLQKVNRTIQANLKNTEFGVNDLSQSVGLSRPQLFRKLKALTDKSIVAYLRSARLHKARQLLKKGDLNISEVAFEVGFNDPLYFSRVFSVEFGFPPSKLLK